MEAAHIGKEDLRKLGALVTLINLHAAKPTRLKDALDRIKSIAALQWMIERMEDDSMTDVALHMLFSHKDCTMELLRELFKSINERHRKTIIDGMTTVGTFNEDTLLDLLKTADHQSATYLIGSVSLDRDNQPILVRLFRQNVPSLLRIMLAQGIVSQGPSTSLLVDLTQECESMDLRMIFAECAASYEDIAGDELLKFYRFIEGEVQREVWFVDAIGARTSEAPIFNILFGAKYHRTRLACIRQIKKMKPTSGTLDYWRKMSAEHYMTPKATELIDALIEEKYVKRSTDELLDELADLKTEDAKSEAIAKVLKTRTAELYHIAGL